MGMGTSCKGLGFSIIQALCHCLSTEPNDPAEFDQEAHDHGPQFLIQLVLTLAFMWSQEAKKITFG